MLSKHARNYESSLPAAKRLRNNVVDLFTSNTISGSRASELLQDAAERERLAAEARLLALANVER